VVATTRAGAGEGARAAVRATMRVGFPTRAGAIPRASARESVQAMTEVLVEVVATTRAGAGARALQ